MKKYIPLKESENNRVKATHLKVETYYNKGGYNYFTYKEEPRGFYLSVSPVERSASASGFMMESYTGFSGVKECVKTVARKSEKAEQEAEVLAQAKEQDLINYVCAKNNLEIA